MADAVVSVVINAEDNASAAIGRVAQSLGALNAQGGNANIQTGKVNEGIKSIGDASEKASNQAKTLDKELTSGSNAINKFNTVSSRLGSAGAKLESWGKATKDFGEGIDDATKPLQKASAGILAAGIATGKAAIDFENNFANVKKTVDGTPEQLEAVEEGLIALGTTGINGRNAIPATTRELTELAATAGQLGIKTENIVDFTEVMAQMGTATNLYGEQGAATLAKFANITGMSQSNFRNLGSSLVALGNNFATTEADIANMSMRLASAGTTVGMSEADILGLATTLSSTGMEAEAGGSAISTVMLDIEDAVTNGGDALEAYAKASGKTAEQFKKDWNNSAINTIMDLFDSLGESDNLAQSVNDLGITEIRQRDAVMRLANAHNQLREAVTMGNTAWQENTALQNEFDAKADTTASQIAVTKNNVVEAARSFGEVMLPSIKNASEGIKDYAQGLARMDDTQKESMINTAKNVVIAGAAVKGITTLIKGAGTVASGLGAIATAAGTTIAPVALAGAGIIALGAGLAYGITKYKEYQNAQRNWGDGAEEAAEKAHEAIEKVQEISGLQREMWDLRQIINNPDSTPEQLEAAKARIEEIAQLLAQEYNLTINVNTSDLDGAVSEVSSYLDTLGQMSVSELEMETGNLKIELGENYGRYAYHEETMSNLQKQWDDNSENAIKYSKAVGKIEGAYGALTRAEEVYKNTTGKEDFRETEEGARLITQAVNETDSALKELGENNATVETLADVEYWLGELEKNYNDYKGKATDAQVRMREEQAAYEKWIQSRERLSQAGITEATKGNTELGLANMKTAINDYGAAVEDVASDWALAQNGFNSFNEAIQSADKDNYVRDLVNNMQALGVQTEYAAAQGALAENGFKTMEQAAQAGGKALDNVARDFGEISLDKGLDLDKINEVAHSLNMIPEWKEITINAEGNVEVIDTVRKAAEDLSEHSDTKLRVTAEGNIEVLETADEKLKALAQAGLVTVKFNFDTGGWDIFSNENGEKIGEITVDGKVNWTTGEVEKPSEEETTAEGKTNFKKGEVEKPSEEETTVEGTINWKVKEIDTPDISGGTSTEGFIVDDWNSWSKGGNSITIEPEVNVNPKVSFNGETVQGGSFDLLEGLGLKSTTASAAEIESVDVPANVNVQAQSVNVESMPEATATEAQTVDVTANVKLHAGNIDFSEFSSYVGMGAQAAAGLTGAQEVDITANVKLHAGTIDYSELSSYVGMGAQAAAGLTGTQEVNVTANINLLGGAIDYSGFQSYAAMGAQAAGGLIGAQETNVTANITLSGGSINTEALSSAVTAAISGITAEGTVEATVTYTVNSSAPDQYKPANKTAVATYTVNSSAPDQYKPANKTATAIYGLDSSAVDSYQPADKYATVHYTVSVEGAIPNAKGTQNFRGGLAMVNDQKGVSDPRELIIDQGRAFIPEGRDVILPLSKGARVFTASQTKAIMSGLGIPHFA
ncbi:MAG: phage tail tape measure protein, partial [Monoglobales bacterium]